MQSFSSAFFGLIGFGLFLGTLYIGCGTFLKSNSAYERGVATALADPAVEEALGAPLEESWFLNGSIEGDGMTSRGVWLVRIRGAEDGGTLRIAGVKTSSEWSVVGLTLETGEARYDYLPGQGFRKAPPGTPGAGPLDILD